MVFAVMYYGMHSMCMCSGVNMYAMLTGRLPFTVEPFNIAALHAKMLDNKMEPIPDHLSTGRYQKTIVKIQIYQLFIRLQGSHVCNVEPKT